jgi:uncharacterized protein YpbB
LNVSQKEFLKQNFIEDHFSIHQYLTVRNQYVVHLAKNKTIQGINFKVSGWGKTLRASFRMRPCLVEL